MSAPLGQTRSERSDPPGLPVNRSSHPRAEVIDHPPTARRPNHRARWIPRGIGRARSPSSVDKFQLSSSQHEPERGSQTRYRAVDLASGCLRPFASQVTSQSSPARRWVARPARSAFVLRNEDFEAHGWADRQGSGWPGTRNGRRQGHLMIRGHRRRCLFLCGRFEGRRFPGPAGGWIFAFTVAAPS